MTNRLSEIKSRLELTVPDEETYHTIPVEYWQGLNDENARIMKELEPVFEALEVLQFYADGAGLDLVDEGRNYHVDYVAYENDFRRDTPLHLDKPVGTMAKMALEKLG